MKKKYFAQTDGWILGENRSAGDEIMATEKEAKFALLNGQVAEQAPPTKKELREAEAQRKAAEKQAQADAKAAAAKPVSKSSGRSRGKAKEEPEAGSTAEVVSTDPVDQTTTAEDAARGSSAFAGEPADPSEDQGI